MHKTAKTPRSIPSVSRDWDRQEQSNGKTSERRSALVVTNPTEQVLQVEGQEIVVLAYPSSLSSDETEAIKRQWAEAGLPGKLVVLSEGATMSVLGRDERLDRIEAKIDALLDALADEGEEMEQPELTLDGEAVGGERDDTQPL